MGNERSPIRFPRKAALNIALAVAFTACKGGAPTPKLASPENTFPPVLTETAKPTPGCTPQAIRISETTPKTPDIVTPTDEMIADLYALNELRDKNGLPDRLPLSNILTRIAQEKADDMNKNDYFDHVNSLGEDIAAMYTRLGYDWKPIGEIIYLGNAEFTNCDEKATHIVKAFSESSSHKTVMLEEYWKAVGIGISYNPDTKIYYLAVEFGTKLDASIYTPPAPTLSPEPTTAYDPYSPTVLALDARRKLIKGYGEELPKAV